MAIKECSFPECTNKAVSFGHCAGHTRQRKANEQLRPLQSRIKRPICEEGFSWCSSCNVKKSTDNFQWETARKRWSRLCKNCRAATQRKHYSSEAGQKRIQATGNIRRRYRELAGDEIPSCAICGITQDDHIRLLSIDHNHSCCPGKRHCDGCTRGLLCHKCNTGLGMFQDNPELLAEAILYLRRYS